MENQKEVLNNILSTKEGWSALEEILKTNEELESYMHRVSYARAYYCDTLGALYAGMYSLSDENIPDYIKHNLSPNDYKCILEELMFNTESLLNREKSEFIWLNRGIFK